MLVLTCLAALGGLVLLVWGGIAYAQAAGRVETMLRVQALDIADDHKAAALAYFDWVSGRISLWRTLWDHIRAPVVLLVPLLRLPREADDLPDALAYWRNDVSINGDGWAAQMPDGGWVDLSGGKPASAEAVLVVPYSDIRYTKDDCYYAPGHHPRSWYARWVWLAWRNVASARAQDAGPLVESVPIVLAREGMRNSTEPGYALNWNGLSGDAAAYQWHSVARRGPLAIWTNVGAKLGTYCTYPETLPSRALLTCTWCALKWGGSS